MRCVCCGYEPTPSERAEQPYGCPKCEPQSYAPSVSAQLKSCATAAFESLRRAMQGTLKAK